ncbi:uncharacterized protein LOC134200486 [Bombyx mori]|uniref:uncharacterized protein LOC134200486 n=1 Tax=Bombyx mori TaxID=7091 RepID=UPI002ED29DF5
MNVLLVILLNLLFLCGTNCVRNKYKRSRQWKLFGYNIDGVIYTSDSDFEHKRGSFTFKDELLEDHEKILIRKNLVPNHINYLFRTIIPIPRTRPAPATGVEFIHTTWSHCVHPQCVSRDFSYHPALECLPFHGVFRAL